MLVCDLRIPLKALKFMRTSQLATSQHRNLNPINNNAQETISKLEVPPSASTVRSRLL
jgi:hypothetical protein